MKKLTRINAVYVIAGLILSTTHVWAGEKINTLDRMMYSINPKTQINGPIFKDKATQIEKNQYASSVVRLILKEADNKAKKYLEAGDTKAYYAFLTLALTVPMHEGLYIQFRNIDENVCKPMANSGERIRKSSEANYKVFVDYLKTGSDAFIPDCEVLSAETSSTQIIRGGDGSDLSMMQVSVRWHADDFLANKKYENVRQTLQYGLGLLMNGFDPVYRNIDQYKCLMEKSKLLGKKKISYNNLIRGIWAGKYNSGTIGKTCRFSDTGSPYKKSDESFANNLNKILSFNETLAVDIVGNFNLNQQERDAVREIVGNLKNDTNNRVALLKIFEERNK